MPFRVVDAEYSSALDRIIAISGSPSRLNIYDPATGTNIPVALPLPANAVSVAPNGLRAAVCQDGLVTIVNLQTATIEKSVNVSVNGYDIVFAGNNYVYMSVTGGWGASDSVNITTGVETKADLLYDGINFQLNAAGDAVYTSNTGTSGQQVTRYTIANGPMTRAYQSEVYPAHPAGYKVWFTRDGRMMGDTGNVFRTGSTLAADFIYTGALSGSGGYMGALGAIAHSTTRHLFASLGTPSYNPGSGTDGTLFLHGDKYLALSSKLTLPRMTIGAMSAESHGKFVFWDNAGAKAYVILQADASAGFLNDYGVYTLSREFTAGCPVTLGINSGTAIGYPDTGGVAVNAASDCVWDVKSNVSWIQIDSGTLGVGTGNVNYSVLANDLATPRTGTITIGGQTFTLTQAGGTTGPPQANTLANPPGGTGDVQTFTFTVSDPKGAQALNIINVLINNALDGHGACYLAYIRPTNTLALVDDGGTSLTGAIVLNGGAASLSNSQCSINGVGSSALAAGNSLTLTINVSFRQGFSGNRIVYLAGREADETTSGWTTVGTWKVPQSNSPTGPSVSYLTPASSVLVGTDVTYTVTFNDTNGWHDLGVVNVLINNALDGRSACYLAFVPATSQVYLVNDAGDTLVAGSAGVSGSSSIQNSQCKITPTGSIGTGTSLSLTFNANFAASFMGNKVIYAAARSNGDVLNSGWQPVSTMQLK